MPRPRPARSGGCPLGGDLVELDATIRSTYGLDTMIITWSESTRVVTDGHVHWIFGPWEGDPARTADGRCAVPARQRRQLRDIARTGLPVQRIAVAHEVPVGSASFRYDEPRHCTPEEARRLVGPVPPHHG
jgi:hypothetical protein